jgi:hypothetical protein
MSLRVARGVYNPEKDTFYYYVSFKPTLDPTDQERGADRTYPIDVALSLTETGELADLAFSLPQSTRSRRSLEYLSRTASASVVNERVFITVPDFERRFRAGRQRQPRVGWFWQDHRSGNFLRPALRGAFAPSLIISTCPISAKISADGSLPTHRLCPGRRQEFPHGTG